MPAAGVPASGREALAAEGAENVISWQPTGKFDMSVWNICLRTGAMMARAIFAPPGKDNLCVAST